MYERLQKEDNEHDMILIDKAASPVLPDKCTSEKLRSSATSKRAGIASVIEFGCMFCCNTLEASKAHLVWIQGR